MKFMYYATHLGSVNFQLFCKIVCSFSNWNDNLKTIFSDLKLVFGVHCVCSRVNEYWSVFVFNIIIVKEYLSLL